MAALKVNDLLLAPALDRHMASTLLQPYGLKDPAKADASLQSIAGNPSERELLAKILEELLACISRSADPDQALTYFERFAEATLSRSQLFSHLHSSPQAMEVLVRSLGGSSYMAEILIRDPQLFYWVSDPDILQKQRSKRALQREIIRTAGALGGEQLQLDYLRILKRREMLHIGVRDLLRLCSVEETWTALSVLAEVLISAAHWICAASLRETYGIRGQSFTRFTVLAMGKLGGGELNFSSDVDLMYLYASRDEEAEGVSAQEFFRALAQKITRGLNDLTGEGYVYRVDLRLRPEGKAGNLADPLDGFQRYYQTRIGTWERLALIKAWPVAGNRALAREFLAMAQSYVYDGAFGVAEIGDILDLKRKIEQKVASRSRGNGPGNRNVKLGTGGIREIELIAQSLQVSHGRRIPVIRRRNTLRTLEALRGKELLSQEEYDVLVRAYIFLRDVENKLQMVDDAQTHSLPVGDEALAVYARLLGQTREQFQRDYDRHTGNVNAIFESLLAKPDLKRFQK